MALTVTDDLVLPIAVFRGGLYDTTPEARPESTWGELVRALTRRRVVAVKEKGVGWSPVTVQPGRTRGLAAVVAVWALVLDYDGTASLSQARDTWAPWAHVGHTTWSGPPSCRIVVPLAAPCPRDAWPRVFAWARARDSRIDKKTKDASRFWFAPATPTADAPFESWTHEGPPLRLAYDRLPEAGRAAQAGPAPARTWGVGARRAAVRRLDDPAVRARAAEYLRVSVNSNGHAKGATCPKCGRPSVWWSTAGGPALCNHRHSCGWVGSLSTLLDRSDAR
jgi:hypothetical protein